VVKKMDRTFVWHRPTFFVSSADANLFNSFAG